MSLRWGLSFLPAWPFAVDRMDTWVLRVSLAIVLVCLVGLAVWQLIAYLAGKLPRKRRPVRESPEPPSSSSSPRILPRMPALADLAALRDDPERLQQACTALEDTLAESYGQLADSWLRQGQPQKAAAALQKILQICPTRPQAQLAHERLLKLGQEVEERGS